MSSSASDDERYFTFPEPVDYPHYPPLPDGYEWYVLNNRRSASVEDHTKRLANRATISYNPETALYGASIWKWVDEGIQSGRGWGHHTYHNTMEEAMHVVSNQLLLGLDDG